MKPLVSDERPLVRFSALVEGICDAVKRLEAAKRLQIHVNDQRTTMVAMTRQKGFTLIELMVAIGLAALLLSMAVPALDQFTTNARQTGAINDFVSSMHIARNTAITTNARVTVCASSQGFWCDGVTWDQGWIAFTDRNGNQAVDGTDRILSASGGIDGLDIQSGEFGQVLQYRPNGRVNNVTATGSSGQFTVCDHRGEDKAKVVIVELSGRPRLSKLRADGTLPHCG
jgi:type IV fimbrial biogenesis protein FimT